MRRSWHLRIDYFKFCLYLYTCNLWNSLPPSVFLFSYSLSSFKCRVYWHLRIDWVFFYCLLVFYWLVLHLLSCFHILFLVIMTRSQWNYLFRKYLEVWESKWVNSNYILYGVNSLRLGGLHLSATKTYFEWSSLPEWV